MIASPSLPSEPRDSFRETEVRRIQLRRFLVFETTITFKLRSQDTREPSSPTRRYLSHSGQGRLEGGRGRGRERGEITGEIKGEIEYEKLGLNETSENLTSGRYTGGQGGGGEFCNCKKNREGRGGGISARGRQRDSSKKSFTTNFRNPAKQSFFFDDSPILNDLRRQL